MLCDFIFLLSVFIYNYIRFIYVVKKFYMNISLEFCKC